MRLNPRYVLLISDAIIPLLGFFIWNWSLYFILLFYFLDMIAQEVIMHLKSRKIIAAQGQHGTKDWRFFGAVGSLVLITAIVMVHLAVLSIHPEIGFINEIKDFWTYEDMGMQQGYFLLPLVAFASYQQYKMSFLMRGRDRADQVKKIWTTHLRAQLVVIAACGLAIGISQLIIFHEVVYVLLIVALIALYNFLFSD